MFSIDTLTDLIGPQPKPVPLDCQVLAREAKDGFEQIEIEYAVEAGERIRAYVLRPPNASLAPAVFCHHQHASNFALGKSEVVGLDGDPDQAIGVELARQGYVVLAPDAIAFESRNWSLPTGRAEYVELAARIVSGQTLLAKVLHDVSVGIDYLTSLDFVDANRIGFIGHSYGGRMALWAPALDSRIKASVSNCGCVNYQDSMDRDIGIQPEFCVPNILQRGDLEDVVRLISPRALYISGTTDDKYSKGAERLYQQTKNTFPATQLQRKVWPGGHTFTSEMRAAAYAFLAEKL